LHRGTDGKGYCEDCLAKNAYNDPHSRLNVVEGAKFEYVEKDRRQEYLEFIITHVTDAWIEKFLEEWKNEMKRSYGWVAELRRIDDDMKLLRLAAELGLGKKGQHKESLVLDNIKLAVETANEDAREQRANRESVGKKAVRKHTAGDKATTIG
jgi:hypothetical protein